jgi:hypothetical protein
MSAGDTYAAFENAMSLRAGWPQLNCSAMVSGLLLGLTAGVPDGRMSHAVNVAQKTAERRLAQSSE